MAFFFARVIGRRLGFEHSGLLCCIRGGERSKESRVLSAFVSATPKYLPNMNIFEIRKENESEQCGQVMHLRSTT